MRNTMSHAALILLAAVSSIRCGGAGAGEGAHRPEGPAQEPAGRPSAEAPEDEIRAVAAIHGGAGPWAVAGYRMGRFALARLGLPARSFDLEVIHHSPRSVQFSCIADGAAAATGASLGKLNLSLIEASEDGVETTYRRRSTGQAVTLRPSAAFRARFRDVPREKLESAGREVLSLPDAEVFEEAPAPVASPPPGAPR
ncbi:formylmethanofuran dehydrogenase subunit E family protein [Sorangium sp. So ce726]|uniref:formylmethanofuran dehydrogenase subunit E family protein n=1 Tax=Sorangium sp. So ce726 TaxID=3133319 RepID=UPI003F60D900